MTHSRPRILVVEDDDPTRSIIGAGLETLGAQLRCVSDGQEALTEVVDFDPQLILLDIMMPRVNGFQFLRRYHEICENPAPVIIVSAKNDRTDRFWAERFGVVNYVVKPFTIVDLRRIVSDHLPSPSTIHPALTP
jgi:DNA-binding response OmpR family regulator